MPDTHVLILGVDENVVVFAVLSFVLAVRGRRARGAEEPIEERVR